MTPKIGLFGGTFDPPHLGHLHMAESALKCEGLDKVIWIPAGRPPHKQNMKISSNEHRLAMLELMIKDKSNFELSKIEFGNEKPSYTIDTLSSFKTQSPFDKYFLIIGSDQAESFGGWKEAKAILMLAKPLVIPRAEHPVSELEATLGNFAKMGVQKLLNGVLDVGPVVVSSTQIRQMASEGKDVSALTGKSIAQYIVKNKLYI